MLKKITSKNIKKNIRIIKENLKVKKMRKKMKMRKKKRMNKKKAMKMLNKLHQMLLPKYLSLDIFLIKNRNQKNTLTLSQK